MNLDPLIRNVLRLWRNAFIIGLAAKLLAVQAQGQIFVSNNFAGTIGKYDYNTGSTVNAAFIAGLNAPRGIALSGSDLYVANYGDGTIGEYNATTGAPINAALVSGLSGPYGIAVSGSYLYVANLSTGTVGKYNATTGATVNATLVSGLSAPYFLALSGSYLYVANQSGNTIGEYNATTGATVKAPFISGLSGPVGIAISGSNLYVVNLNNGTIGEYNVTTGATIKAPFVSGLPNPIDVAIVGANLFVTNSGSSNTVSEYNATTGATMNASFISGLNSPVGIAAVATPQEFNLRAVPLQSNAWGSVTVNEALNKIYVSGNPGDSNNTNEEVVVIDGVTFAPTDVGYGSQVSVDNKTNRYWAATIFGTNSSSFGCGSPPPYPAGVIVRDGTTDCVVDTISLGYCPITTTYDFFKGRVWVGAQCGPNNDPVFAINANSPFNDISGPIASGGIMGSIIANGANGRLYIYDSTPTPVSNRVNPTTFAVTPNNFGQVETINPGTNRLYAVSGNNLQIINGATDPETILATIALGYTPGSMGINGPLNRLYIANPAANNIEIRNPSTGALISTFALSAFPGVNPNGAMAVDSTRNRIYVIDQSSSPKTLLVIEDLINATTKFTTSGLGGGPK